MSAKKPHELDYTFMAVCKQDRSWKTPQVTPSLHLFSSRMSFWALLWDKWDGVTCV